MATLQLLFDAMHGVIPRSTGACRNRSASLPLAGTTWAFGQTAIIRAAPLESPVPSLIKMTSGYAWSSHSAWGFELKPPLACPRHRGTGPFPIGSQPSGVLSNGSHRPSTGQACHPFNHQPNNGRTLPLSGNNQGSTSESINPQSCKHFDRSWAEVISGALRPTWWFRLYSVHFFCLPSAEVIPERWRASLLWPPG